MGIFKPSSKEDSFITQLKLLAEKTEACLSFLEKHIDSITDDILAEMKTQIDDLMDTKMILLDDLHNSFITPIDREDIYHIAACLSGLAKYAQTTIEEMHMLNVQPDAFIREMVGKVHDETKELTLALNRLMKNPRIAYDHSLNVTKIEARIDKTYREAVKVLFADTHQLATALQSILYRREVYRHISNMSDKAEAAAQALGMAIIKLS